VKDDIHSLGNADPVNVLDQAQGNKWCTAAVVNQECEASAVEHPCPIKHVWRIVLDNTPGGVRTRTPTFGNDHFRSRSSFHSAMPFFTVIGADVNELDGFGDVVAETLFVASTIGNEGVQDKLLDMG